MFFGAFLYYILHREKPQVGIVEKSIVEEIFYINPLIFDHLQNNNPKIRIDAIDDLYAYYSYTDDTYTYSNRRIREILKSLLLDHDPTVVAAVAHKLVQMGDDEVVSDLYALLEDNRSKNNTYEDQVRLVVLLALADIDKDSALDIIIEELKKSEDIYHAQDVLYVLAKLQSPKSLEALFDHIQFLKNNRPSEDQEDLNKLWNQQISDIEVIITTIRNKKPS